ncbi:MAG: nickel-dependent lactate racemase [Erysipelotrichaceae bacterium]|nr:nickel-dependent lactate racemase [Erysipelotrichaceae bacterium]
MITELKKGNEVEKVILPKQPVILNPANLPEDLDEAAVVKKALEEPIGSKRLNQIVKPGDKIVIITSDITRPMPTGKVMDPLMEELLSAGVSPDNVTLVFARGSHRHHSQQEMAHLAGNWYGKICCVDSDSENVIHLGTTSSGTPVDIDARVVQADRRICLGNVEFHYFAGYSGGAKAIMPGVSTVSAITMNHRMMVDPRARAGNLDDNPVRRDIEEAGKMTGIDFIVNVVLNTRKQIIYCAAGDSIQAHRDACAYLNDIYRSPISAKADIVIVSQGGAPKDLNLYQTQKALDNAGHAVKDGGTVILVGSCFEGFGNQVFEEWMLKYTNPDDMIQALHAHFQLGAHKATAIAMLKKRADILFVSDMDSAIVEKTFLKPVHDLQSAVDACLRKYGNDADVIVMPYGGSTLPVCQ